LEKAQKFAAKKAKQAEQAAAAAANKGKKKPKAEKKEPKKEEGPAYVSPKAGEKKGKSTQDVGSNLCLALFRCAIGLRSP